VAAAKVQAGGRVAGRPGGGRVAGRRPCGRAAALSRPAAVWAGRTAG